MAGSNSEMRDLQTRVAHLTRAFKGVVAAAGDMSLANREEALATARRVLTQATSGQPVPAPMIFGKLDTLRPGARIIVVLSDGSRRLFLVVSKKTVPAGSAPPGLADPYGPPRLTLVTCAGHFDQARYSYSSRLMVEARYAGLT